VFSCEDTGCLVKTKEARPKKWSELTGLMPIFSLPLSILLPPHSSTLVSMLENACQSMSQVDIPPLQENRQTVWILTAIETLGREPIGPPWFMPSREQLIVISDRVNLTQVCLLHMKMWESKEKGQSLETRVLREVSIINLPRHATLVAFHRTNANLWLGTCD
jgi:hypothetical protein